jgi:hypothetical protein
MPSATSRCRMELTGIVWSGAESGRHPWKISVADHQPPLQDAGLLAGSVEWCGLCVVCDEGHRQMQAVHIKYG